MADIRVTGVEPMKEVRTDAELELTRVDQSLRETGAGLVLLPATAGEDVLAFELRDADLILTCYAQVPARLIAGAPRLKGIVKYGVGIDAIDIEAANRRQIPVVNVPEYAEETVAEGAVALMLAPARKFKPLQREMETRGRDWPTEKLGAQRRHSGRGPHHPSSHGSRRHWLVHTK